jgi:hypothetical protein
MTKKEYMEFHRSSCDKMIEITKKKNADYSGTGDDPFANFRRIGHSDQSWILIGFLTRMTDKMARLESFIQRGYLLVEDESFEDSCLDLANYSILLSGYVKSMKPATQTEKPAENFPELR